MSACGLATTLGVSRWSDALDELIQAAVAARAQAAIVVLRKDMPGLPFDGPQQTAICPGVAIKFLSAKDFDSAARPRNGVVRPRNRALPDETHENRKDLRRL